ncbi:unnamed protein product [Enterobius vermicularis]|uniref:PWWP domain-containing protein n=1 Tax=Enterobius vermicularis TaxID=51028 RepID=A0A158Q9I6_ENTVE|nr:unnamed protein product [Enterobius vermicularis]
MHYQYVANLVLWVVLLFALFTVWYVLNFVFCLAASLQTDLEGVDVVLEGFLDLFVGLVQVSTSFILKHPNRDKLRSRVLGEGTEWKEITISHLFCQSHLSIKSGIPIRVHFLNCYWLYLSYFSKPELEIGTRLEVVVIGKSWDNYVIKSSQNGADYFGMIYLGRWVHERQPAYSSRGSDVPQQNVFANYPNGTFPIHMTNKTQKLLPNYESSVKFLRQKELVEVQQQQQRFRELTNGREKQTINHGAPQGPAMVPSTLGTTQLLLKKNKRKAYVPRGMTSLFSTNLPNSRPQEFPNFENGSSEPLGNDEFTKLLMRYVLKDERGSNFNGTGDRSSNPERSFEDYLQLDQTKRLLGPQRRICIKGKDPPNDVIRHTRNAYGVSRGGFGVGSLSHAGASHEMSQSESGSQCTSVPVLETSREMPAVGTANFVNVTPLNITAEKDPPLEDKNSSVDDISVIASVSTSSAVPQSSSSPIRIPSAASTSATSATVTPSQVSSFRPGSPVSALSPTPTFTPLSILTPVGPNTSATSAVALTPAPSSNSTPPSGPGSGSAPAPVSDAPDTSIVDSGLEEIVVEKPQFSPQNGTLASLLECEELTADTQEDPDTSDPNSDEKLEKAPIVCNSPNLPSFAEVLTTTRESEGGDESENEGLANSSKIKFGGSKKANATDNRKIVVKISLGSYPHSTMETKSSPATSTSSESTRRSVADLRCPPEIAKSFEEQDVVRRSETGCPPMVPRSNQDYEDVEENVDVGEKEKKKKKTSGKKKKVENVEEKEVAHSTPFESASRAAAESAFDNPTVEENPFSLVAGDIVWAKNGSEPFWPGELFQFTRVNGVAGAVITWFGVDTFTPFVPLPKIEPFARKYSQRFNPKRNDRKYQKGVARAIYQCRPQSGYFESNITKCIYEVLVNNYHFVLEPFEGTKKRKRKSGGFGLKKKKLPSHGRIEIHEPVTLPEDYDHTEDDESGSIDDSSGMPEADMDPEQMEASCSEQHLSETSSSDASPHKSEDSGQTSPRSPIL